MTRISGVISIGGVVRVTAIAIGVTVKGVGSRMFKVLVERGCW